MARVEAVVVGTAAQCSYGEPNLYKLGKKVYDDKLKTYILHCDNLQVYVPAQKKIYYVGEAKLSMTNRKAKGTCGCITIGKRHACDCKSPTHKHITVYIDPSVLRKIG